MGVYLLVDNTAGGNCALQIALHCSYICQAVLWSERHHVWHPHVEMLMLYLESPSQGSFKQTWTYYSMLCIMAALNLNVNLSTSCISVAFFLINQSKVFSTQFQKEKWKMTMLISQNPRWRPLLVYFVLPTVQNPKIFRLLSYKTENGSSRSKEKIYSPAGSTVTAELFCSSICQTVKSEIAF